MFTESQQRRMDAKPVKCLYCDHIAPSHTARIAHETQEHEPSRHGKKAAKRERERYAAAKR